MIAVDTNIVARFYCDDPDDPESRRQRPVARRLLIESGPVYVPVTVVLELEWVMRGHYALPPDAFVDAITHLLGVAHVVVEDWEAVADALALHSQGFDFADALHWAKSKNCSSFATFDDRGFAKRAARRGLSPAVTLAR